MLAQPCSFAIVKPGNPFAEPHVIVVMGVAASGKTTIGRALAYALGWPFYDGDDFHTPANKAKMHNGVPLTDEDRQPWLAALGAKIGEIVRQSEHAVVACSALKVRYREVLVPAGTPAASVRFVYLDVSRATLAARLAERQHFFPASLLDSQLDTLEPPHDAVWADGAKPVPEIVESVRAALRI
jgi:gluconokinase